MATHELVILEGDVVEKLPQMKVKPGEKLTFNGRDVCIIHIVLECQTVAGFLQVLATIHPYKPSARQQPGVIHEALSLTYYGIIENDQKYVLAFEASTEPQL